MTSFKRKPDVRDRIFVGQGHLKQDIPTQMLLHAEAFLKRFPDAFAMLEFTSPGLDKRQIDCALVSAGGIDIIEVKRHSGFIEGTIDGKWRQRGSGRVVSNKKKNIAENPYQQAQNTAADFTAWLDTKYGVKVRVTPLVFMPNADPTSNIVRNEHVRLALGNTQKEFTAALRSAFRNHSGGWDGADFWDLPYRLGLQPMNMAFVQGRVIDALNHAPLKDLQVWVQVAEERVQITTNASGIYEFAVRLNDEVLLGVVSPDAYLSPDPIQLRATQPFQNVDDFILPERYVKATEAELRVQVEKDLRARWQEQLNRTEAAWNDNQLAMGLVIDDLKFQLRAVLKQLGDKEQELHAAMQTGPRQQLPLPLLVRQASELNMIEAQRAEVAEAMKTLQGVNNEGQQAAVQDVISVLTRVVSSRQQLPPVQGADLPVRLTKATPWILAPLADEEVAFVDDLAPAPQPAAVHHERRAEREEPASRQSNMPSAPSAAPMQEAAPENAPAPSGGSGRSVPWPWIVSGGVALMAAGLAGAMLLRPPASVPQPPSVPAVTTTSQISAPEPSERAPITASDSVDVTSETPATEAKAVKVTPAPVERIVAKPQSSPAPVSAAAQEEVTVAPVQVQASPMTSAPAPASVKEPVTPTRTAIPAPVSTPVASPPARTTVPASSPAQVVKPRPVQAAPAPTPPVQAKPAPDPSQRPAPAPTPALKPAPVATPKPVTAPSAPAPAVLPKPTSVEPTSELHTSPVTPEPTVDATDLPGVAVDSGGTAPTSDFENLPGTPVH